MPFQSQAQRRFMYARHPEMAKEWEAHTPKGKKLPEHKKKKKEAEMKTAKKDMPHFTEQDRPEKVKDIYRALKREHPGMPAEMKARIAARQGKPGKQKQGPPYKAPIKERYKGANLGLALPMSMGLSGAALGHSAVRPGAESEHSVAGPVANLLSMLSGPAAGVLAGGSMPSSYWNLVKRVAGSPGSGLPRALAAGGMTLAPSLLGGAAAGGLSGLLAHLGKKKPPEEADLSDQPTEASTVMPDQKVASLRNIVTAGLTMVKER